MLSLLRIRLTSIAVVCMYLLCMQDGLSVAFVFFCDMLLHSLVSERIVWTVLAGQLVMLDVFVQAWKKYMCVYKRSFIYFLVCLPVLVYYILLFQYIKILCVYFYVYKGL